MPRPMSAAVARDRRLRGILCGAGLQETCTFSFLERPAAEPFLPAGVEPSSIANPLSEKFAVLRPSLLPGLLDALVYSRRRETDDVRLFEAGAIFLPGGEANRVGWMLTGARLVHWSGSAGELDVFDSKGIAELIGEAFGVRIAAQTGGDDCLGTCPAALRSSSSRATMRRRSWWATSASSCRPSSRERGLAQGTVWRERWTMLAVESHTAGARITRLNRCRAFRQSSATCRSSSVIACLPRMFVARSARPHRARSCQCASSIAIRARACRRVRPACRCD